MKYTSALNSKELEMPLNNYISEFALNMQTERKAFCRLSEFDFLESQNYFNEEFPCHIYMIVRRPKLSIDKNGLTFNREKIFLNFKAQVEDAFDECTIELPNLTNSNNLRLETNYPYWVFRIFDENKEIIYTNATSLLYRYPRSLLGDFSKNLNLEVLYIGQAFGKEGKRNAIDRLKSHSTLQGIYEEANKNNPDKDILLCLFTFKQWLLAAFDGRKKLSEEERGLDNLHAVNVMNRILHHGITTQQEINFTEAALIKYFQPPYNIDYKNTFPNPAHSTYSECYDIDINSICLEIDTQDLNCCLFSKDVEPKWIHFASYNLHNREDRISIFNIVHGFGF